MFTFKTKIKNVPNDLKEEPDLKSRFALHYLAGNAWILNMPESQCGQICLDICNFVNIPEVPKQARVLNISESAQTRFRICMNCS